MDEIKIGKATVAYNEDGTVSHSMFEPVIETNMRLDEMVQLQSLPAATDSEALRKNAENVVSQWLTKVQNIDLIDQFEYGFVSTVKECVKYGSGQIKKCVIEFSLKKFETVN